MRLAIFIAAFISPLLMANPLIGTWEFVKGEYATPEGIVSAKAPDVTSMKIINNTHFSYITSSNNKFHYAGGGTYQVKDNYFIETVTLGNVEKLIGRRMAFTYEVKDNLWHHKLVEDGKFVEYEVWKKVD
ncbi:hypothetical protein N474_10735 [Pseudoalteromonas luteoviolacea CPMOR-2]|uniref:DUF4488 domain-containing protein n=1 Tax=Pseudoalteromonas luteoviolacea DSM 6061 TaxID=1365250 RepID=A0A166VCD8_9GAMM|nr:hypothetical protein [Pseudoalteromonas luteoviolacea]KZN32482.1 hypothetical protein N475_22640 [Pseudoalteromonas luteoviolacea DSM 6061]KZN56620.1 hypothetical protein N474_10735 [Pseudoalteromonas luteoviolacea CPMOR-2]MBE0386002.1 hypothetical protein [Pseudoalteromonas luteoviolacea DSM 6061]